jgi:HEAT repeat protein
MRAFFALCLSIVAVVLLGCGKDAEEKQSDRVAKILLTANNREAVKEFAQKEGLPGIKRLFETDSSQNRMFGITCLGLLKDNQEATDLLIKFANGEDSEDSYWAVIALGVKGAPEAKAQIEKLLKGEDSRRRQGACVAIAEYGDTTLYPLLGAAARDDDPRVRRTAERALQTIREGKVVP